VKKFEGDGKLTVYSSKINNDSLILLNYVRDSKGTVPTVDEQGSGWARLSGTAYKWFRFIVIN
jgi:hypothetical protein